ncbi:hypothetical protein, partial [uncultured Desulfovibrio sp.]|uniref:hypothetical protein n=1 Tax=uncultured Desulfovibrio sp. TaxID=167968 RepID=UPI0026193856
GGISQFEGHGATPAEDNCCPLHLPPFLPLFSWLSTNLSGYERTLKMKKSTWLKALQTFSNIVEKLVGTRSGT